MLITKFRSKVVTRPIRKISQWLNEIHLFSKSIELHSHTRYWIWTALIAIAHALTIQTNHTIVVA